MTVLEFAISLVLVILGIFLSNEALRWLIRKATRTSQTLNINILKSLRPAVYFLWLAFVVGIILVFSNTFIGWNIDLNVVSKSVFIVILVSLNIFLLIFFSRQAKSSKSKKIDPSLIKATSSLAKLLLVSVSALLILQNLGVNTAGLLALGSVGGLAVGFASKDMLTNFFGGLTIYLDRPFKTGDWIRSPERNIEGTVESISWRRTVIRTFDKRPLYVPNSTFLNLIIENPSRMTNRRIYETIGIRYQDAEKLSQIIIEIKDYLQNNPNIDAEQTLMVNFNKFADSSLDIMIYCFCKTVVWAEYHRVKDEVLQKINQIITNNQAQIAFPTKTLEISHLDK